MRIKNIKAYMGGVVTAKLQERTSGAQRGDDSFRYYTEFTVVIKTEAGKTKRIVERDSAGKCATIWLLVTVFGITSS